MHACEYEQVVKKLSIQKLGQDNWQFGKKTGPNFVWYRKEHQTHHYNSIRSGIFLSVIKIFFRFKLTERFQNLIELYNNVFGGVYGTIQKQDHFFQRSAIITFLLHRAFYGNVQQHWLGMWNSMQKCYGYIYVYKKWNMKIILDAKSKYCTWVTGLVLTVPTPV